VYLCLAESVSGVLYCATTLAHAKVVGVLGAFFVLLPPLAPNLYKFSTAYFWAVLCAAAYFLALSQAFDCYPYNPAAVVKVKDKVLPGCG